MSHGLKNKLVIALIFFISAMALEMITFIYTDNIFFSKYFGLDIAMLSIFSVIIILCIHDLASIVVSLVLLLIQILISYLNINLLAITGEVFSWDMLILVSEGAAAMGKGMGITFTYLLIVVPVYALIIFMYVIFYKKYKNKNYKFSIGKFSSYSLVSVLLLSFAVGIYQLSLRNIQASVNKYNKQHTSLNDTFLFNTFYLKKEALSKFGTYGYYTLSLIDYHVINNVQTDIEETYESYTKAHDSNLFTNVSNGNNLIVMLFETGDISAINKDLTPNLYNLISDSLYLSSYYSKDQTNISEAKFLFGSYPMQNILNYNYLENDYSFNLPNIYKSMYPEAQVVSFHGNSGTYYKRRESHLHYGFNAHVDWEDSKLPKFSDWVTPDSYFFDAALSTGSNTTTYNIIPEDTSKQFFSYIATFSTHGVYYFDEGVRSELEPYREIVRNYQAAGNTIKTIFGETMDANDEMELNYLAMAIDFDVAIGKMMNDLKTKNLEDKTTIVILSDHYSYLNDYSKTVRGITDESNPELYHCPGFIYDTKLKNKILNNTDKWDEYQIKKITYKDNYSSEFLCCDKFFINIDCTPTVLNLLGYKYNEADYLGNDLFSKNESYIISRWGGIFNNKYYTQDGYQILNKLQFSETEDTGLRPADYTEEMYYADLADITKFRENVSKFIEKYTFINKLYEDNYYATHALKKY